MRLHPLPHTAGLSHGLCTTGTNAAQLQLNACLRANVALETRCRGPWLAAQSGNLNQIARAITVDRFDVNTQDPFGAKNRICGAKEDDEGRRTGHGLTVLLVAVSAGDSGLVVQVR